MAFTLVLVILVLYVMSVAYWMAMSALVLLGLSRVAILFCLVIGCFGFGGLDTVRNTKVKGHAVRIWFGMMRFVNQID